MMSLHPIDPGKLTTKLYCGPAALCAITGMKGHEIVERVNEMRGKKSTSSVRWMTTSEVKAVLRGFGYTPVSHDFRPGTEFVSRFVPQLPAHKPHVILVTNHFIATLGSEFEDNRWLLPTPIDRYPKPRKRVQVLIDILPGMD